MVPLHPKIWKAEKVQKKYEKILKSMEGVLHIGLGGNVNTDIVIRIGVATEEAVELVKAVIVPEIEGVKTEIYWRRVGGGALDPDKTKPASEDPDPNGHPNHF